DGRNFLVENNGNGTGGGAEGDSLRLAVKVAGSQVPVLAFAAVHRQFDGVPIGAMKRLIAVEKSLHGVFARRHVAKIADGITEGVGVVDERRLAWSQGIHVDAKNDLRLYRKTNLRARLGGGIRGQEQQNAAVEGRCAAFFWKGNRELNLAIG